MTPFDMTRLPVPEGCAWVEDGPGDYRLTGVGQRFYLRARILINGRITFDAGLIPGFVVAPEHAAPEYHRALIVVGLASPWTSEVPTQPGDYLVAMPDDGPRMYHFAGNGTGPTWKDDLCNWRYASHFPPGTLFMPCPQPPKEAK